VNLRRLLPVLLLLPFLGACAPQSSVKKGDAKNTASLNVDLGKVYIGQHDYNRAMEKLKRALTEDPNYAPAHNTIAVLYWRLGEMDKAEQHFRRAVELAPKDSLIHNSYGAFLCARNQIPEAEAQFEAALRNPLYDNPEIAYTNAGICALRTPDKAKAEKYFRAALRRAPRFAPALFHMAEISYEQKKFLQARGYYQRYREVGPENAASLWLGILIENKLNNQDAVASYALRLKNKFPDSNEARLLSDMEKHD
jgi:type IV pilus assembly protein PilF